jgi:dihydroorotate dehydrogenase electron transfer subunit
MEIRDLIIREAIRANGRCVLLKLTDDQAPLPADIRPGQFVEVRVDGSPKTFLRRPISVCFVDRQANELWLLVAVVGDGTRRMAAMKPGERLNCVLPLGNGFSPLTPHPSPLLIGGGVGVAPLLYQGAVMKEGGIEPTFLLGARTKGDLLLLDEFGKYGRVEVTTEDGSMGEKGFVTQHSILRSRSFDRILTCGPTPMMKAVARYARQNDIDCEASLENLMACGLGSCLCCVEKVRSTGVQEFRSTGVQEYRSSDNSREAEQATTNVCVCKEGPVFNIKRLLWQD